MPTLVLTPRFTDDSQALWRAAGQAGWQVERVHGWRLTDDLKRVPDPVLYVEVLVAPTFAEQLGLRLHEPPEDWLVNLPERYRKRQVYLTTLADARGIATPAFVKPPNDKSFPAQVYNGADLPTEYDPGMSVLVAEVVRWRKEFRCFVLDRQIRTLSVYLRDGVLQRDNGFVHDDDEERELRDFVEPMLADPDVALDRTAVIDVGVIDGRGWAVVEQNCAWGAGIYGCDPAEVLEVLRHAADRA